MPVGAITNGVHVPTWVAGRHGPALRSLPRLDWRERIDDPAFWERVVAIPDEELWKLQGDAAQVSLFTFIRERARERWMHERVSAGARRGRRHAARSPDALTIGFARRFAAYKRAELIFRDPERLARILNDPRRPVQIVFAGKAHPADDGGKRHAAAASTAAPSIRQFGGRVAFVDDYDLHVAHYLVQGCDVWLNNPRKPLEASGTSGMKAAMNGVPSTSASATAGGPRATPAQRLAHRSGHVETGDHDARTRPTPAPLYRLLEEQIVPAFYERDEQGVPRALDVGRQGGDPHRRAALLHPPDGQGVRRDDVRAGHGVAAEPADLGRRERRPS